MPRSWLLANRVLFMGNVVFLLALVVLWFLPRVRLERLASRQANKLGQELYFSRPPFSLLVDPSFPQNPSFTLLAEGYPLVVTLEEISENRGVMHDVAVAFGDGFSMSCQSAPHDTKIDEFTVSLGSCAVTDLNADGFPDVRAFWEPEPRLEVWYRDEWTEVQLGGETGKYEKRCRDGTHVSYDIDRGTWDKVTRAQGQPFTADRTDADGSE